MGDRTAGAEAARRELATNVKLQKQLALYGYWKTNNRIDGFDLAREAMRRAIDPEASPWDRRVHGSLKGHILSIMNSLFANEQRAQRHHPSEPFDEEAAPPAAQATPEETLLANAERAQLEAWMAELLHRLDGDAIALGKIELTFEGIDAADEQAERLHCTVEDIRRAGERIAYHARIVKSSRPRPAEPRAKGGPPLPAPDEGSEP